MFSSKIIYNLIKSKEGLYFFLAYEITNNFTYPIIISTWYFDKTVSCGIGSFVIINSDGWILTIEHLIRTMAQFQKDKKELNEYTRALSDIDNPSLSDKRKKIEKNRLKASPKRITKF